MFVPLLWHRSGAGVRDRSLTGVHTIVQILPPRWGLLMKRDASHGFRDDRLTATIAPPVRMYIGTHRPPWWGFAVGAIFSAGSRSWVRGGFPCGEDAGRYALRPSAGR